MKTKRRVGSRILTAVLCALVLGLPTLADPPEKPDPLHQELDLIGKLIMNAQMKLRRGIVGLEPAGGETKAVRTPADACCGENVERLNKRLDTVRAMIRDLGTCFEQKWDRGGAEAVNLATQDLRALTVGIKAFSEATEPADTYGALDGTQRAFLNLKRRIDVLPKCEVEVPAAPK